jgi:BirA family biotin operon repressor/biotin-[acetyl-CoA-carboxylase] ligase
LSAAFPPVIHRASVGSTNDEARRLARAGAADMTTLRADEQTGGRGRGGRSWASPAGNLYLSLIIRPHCPASRAAELGFIAGLALTDMLAPHAGASAARLKWPNDVLLGGRKLAGILLEAESNGERLECVVIGMGANLISHPDATAMPATDLLTATGRRIDPRDCVEPLRAAFARWREAWEEAGFAVIRESWRARAAGRGERVRVRLPTGDITGRFEDIDADGALLLTRPDGARQRISAGDVLLPA